MHLMLGAYILPRLFLSCWLGYLLGYLPLSLRSYFVIVLSHEYNSIGPIEILELYLELSTYTLRPETAKTGYRSLSQ